MLRKWPTTPCYAKPRQAHLLLQGTSSPDRLAWVVTPMSSKLTLWIAQSHKPCNFHTIYPQVPSPRRWIYSWWISILLPHGISPALSCYEYLRLFVLLPPRRAPWIPLIFQCFLLVLSRWPNIEIPSMRDSLAQSCRQMRRLTLTPTR